MSNLFSRGRTAGAVVVVGQAVRLVVAEMLEERRLFATFTVTNPNADGPGSLWQAVLDANASAGADVIEFSGVPAGTITTRGTLRVTESVDIRGPGKGTLLVEPANDPQEGRPQGWLIDGPGDNTVRIADLTITNGRGGDHNGGAIQNSENLILDHVSVSHSSAAGGAGGGIANYGGLTLLFSQVFDNSAGGSAGDGGGGIYQAAGDLLIRNSEISGNSSTGGAEFGGGIYVAGGRALIENSTISGNRQSGSGGGIATAGNTTIRDCTIVNNKAEAGLGGAPEAGGGVYVIAGSLDIVSTIVANNQTQQSNDQPFVAGDIARRRAGPLTFITATASLFGTSEQGIFLKSIDNLFSTDPKVGPLAANGGPTLTHALLDGSPAINRGTNGAGSLTDQRGNGFDRPFTNADIGAFELQERTKVVSIDESLDAYVQDGGSKNTNFGGEQRLLVKKSSSAGSNRIAYIRFDLLAWDSSERIGVAKLVLVGRLTKAQSGGLAMSVLAVSNTTWSETGITYNNKPATGATLTTFTLNSTEPTRVELDITAYVEQQRAAGRTSVAFAIKGNANTSALAEFESDETASSGSPRLTLEEAALPPAGSFLSPTQDTYARNGSFANTSHGQETELLVKSGNSDGAKREAYLKFNIADVEGSPTASTLRLFGRVSDDRAASLGVTLYGASSNSWNENELTYANKPAATSSLGNKTITSTAGQWYEFDVTSYIAAAKAAGKSSVTFVIKANASSSPWVAFNSAEAATNGPQLVTQFATN